MERLEKEFNIGLSPLREAYVLLGAMSPLELSNKYAEEDQLLMKDGLWDYNNKDLLVNKIKGIIENTPLQGLEREEQGWAQEILWFWNHHAISCAIWKYRDREAAKKYVEDALAFQSENHPNKITKLFQLLLDDKIEEAEAWAEGIEKDNVEYETARELINDYKKNKFSLL